METKLKWVPGAKQDDDIKSECGTYVVFVSEYGDRHDAGLFWTGAIIAPTWIWLETDGKPFNRYSVGAGGLLSEAKNACQLHADRGSE